MHGKTVNSYRLSHQSNLLIDNGVGVSILLTHWGRVRYKCVSKLTIFNPDNGLSLGCRQAIVRTNVGLLLIRTLGINFDEIWSKIYTFSFKQNYLKLSRAKWRQFCLDLNVLTYIAYICMRTHIRLTERNLELFDISACKYTKQRPSFYLLVIFSTFSDDIVKRIKGLNCKTRQLWAANQEIRSSHTSWYLEKHSKYVNTFYYFAIYIWQLNLASFFFVLQFCCVFYYEDYPKQCIFNLQRR